MRQFDTGQSGDPDARIELWEDGSLVRAGSDTAVTGAGQVIAFTWNANEIGTADGTLVECKVVGSKSGGSPSNRNTVEVGAVEWNADFDLGTRRAIVTWAEVALAESAGGGIATGTGAATLPAITASGAGAITRSGDGAADLPSLTASGVGAMVWAGEGAIGDSIAKSEAQR